MRAYHFLRANMRSGEGNEPPWYVGEERTIDGPIEMCIRGYHSSPTLYQAWQYAPGPVATIVEIPDEDEGTIVGDDKCVSPKRKLLAAVNIEKGLIEYAADCAEHVLHLFEACFPGDDRPRKAIEAARLYARGEVGREGLDAARAAAWAAAQDAARAAVWAVAGDATEWAAWDAARDAEQAWQREQFERRFGRIFDHAIAERVS